MLKKPHSFICAPENHVNKLWSRRYWKKEVMIYGMRGAVVDRPDKMVPQEVPIMSGIFMYLSIVTPHNSDAVMSKVWRFALSRKSLSCDYGFALLLPDG